MENTEVTIRKGSWTAEEDEVLINHVKMHGPRDWSNIRSKGLLPRTGKSCRLRWVNKLRPNLKYGCKFSADEERAVIDLQARFGNKWARIATYLPGRTDNDVKNFWSTRVKRLARLLQTPLPVSVRSQRRQHKAPMSAQVPNVEQPSVTLPYYPFGEEFQSADLPLFSEDQDLMPELCDMSSTFQSHFSFAEMELPVAPRFFDHGIEIERPGTPDSYFGEFPVDLFEYLDHPPAS